MIKEILEKFNDNIILITIVSIFNKISILENKFKLQKNVQKNTLIILDGPPLFDNGYDYEISKKYKKDAKEQLEKFIFKMEQNIPKENLLIMYNNLSTLNLEERNLYLIILSKLKFPFSKGIIGGRYAVSHNKMITYSYDGLQFVKRLFNSENEITLEGIYSHELLHMSSSNKSNGKLCSGFHHIYGLSNKIMISSIARGINEGYTELLNERIFDSLNEGGIYEFYKEATRLIEFVVGRERMTNMYFSNDLKGLVNYLSLYVSEKSTKKFILNMDLILRNTNVIQEILDYLVILVNNKIQNDLSNNLITNGESIKQYAELKNKIKKMVLIIIDMENSRSKVNNSINLNTDTDSIIDSYNGKSRGNIKFVTLSLIIIILLLVIMFLILIIN